ncbi:DNA primase DnaG [Thermofilum pendens]|uniref:DNA primase DnaG n=1 Tax=Thermofilum pendens (strain DSM 2475 / Hrk 5) TaxID=368408 RepID=DNAG_THEPD|nr:DNA primase DnaG [Thermofilum pendens]A1RXH8.1 RecName: Full=DNA primase DnaG [Thermofilum pendens Hrk 5]ABL77908.1 TOPRIM domain protein [Thermofilum pendens Hrk 5]
MGGLPVSPKYVIKAKMEIKGSVEKHDIIGAIFGQAEGLLGSELDLRELQKTGRVGRIEVNTRSQDGTLVAEIEIPTNLDMAETAIIAATIESIDKVGPYPAKTEVVSIEDVRAEKRQKIIERAVELYKKLLESVPESRELVEEVLRRVRVAEIVEYGEEKLPGGPEVETSDTVILVEGRADVQNLLRHGYKNVIALGGATIPKSIKSLVENKKVILFVDGDRGGELIARNVINALKVDFVARAPPGREVEDLTAKEIARALQNKIPVDEFLQALEREKKQQKEVKAEIVVPPAKLIKSATKKNPEIAQEIVVPAEVYEKLEELKGTLEAVIYDENWQVVEKVPVRDLVNRLKEVERAAHVVLDGIITQRLVDVAYTKGLKSLIGVRIGEIIRKPDNIVLATFSSVKKSEENIQESVSTGESAQTSP